MEKDFNKIIEKCHMNWSYDINLVYKIYKEYPDSYGILFPFMYSYLEESIRSLTSEFGNNHLRDKKKYTVGMGLLNLAIKENSENKKLVDLLKEYKKYFKSSSIFDEGDNRNSVNHGYTHPILWSKENFEELVKDIARLSEFNIM